MVANDIKKKFYYGTLMLESQSNNECKMFQSVMPLLGIHLVQSKRQIQGLYHALVYQKQRQCFYVVTNRHA